MNWKWIHDACWAGDPVEVAHLTVALRYFAENGWRVDAADGEGNTALHKAIRTLPALGTDPGRRTCCGAAEGGAYRGRAGSSRCWNGVAVGFGRRCGFL